jgi:hypothetical protein
MDGSRVAVVIEGDHQHPRGSTVPGYGSAPLRTPGQ